MSVDSFVEGDGVQIAVRDFGGSGSPIVFIPGAGCNLVDVSLMAPYLTGSHRLIGVDLRGHGFSGDGTWTFEHVLNDVRAVIAHFQLTDVTILGHSLGGMIAAMLTASGEARVGINLDGHGMGSFDLYDGVTEEEHAAAMAKAAAMNDGQGIVTLKGLKLAVTRLTLRRQYQKLGFSRAQAEERIARQVQANPDGSVSVRPNGEPAKQMAAAIEELKLIQLYDETKSPLLVYNATVTKLPKKVPAELAAVMAGYRRGLARALTELAATNSLVSYQQIDATHFLILEEPALIASQVKAFIAAS